MWLALHLCAQSLGVEIARQTNGGMPLPPQFDPSALVRASGLLPMLLSSGGQFACVGMVGGTVALNVLAGIGYRRQQERRVMAVTQGECRAAVPVVWRGGCVVRVTGWPRLGTDGRWSVASRVLAWEPGAIGAGSRDHPHKNDGVLLSGKHRPPHPGAVLGGRFELRPPPIATVPGAFDDRRYLAGRGLRWRGTVKDHQYPAQAGWLSWCGRRILRPVRNFILARLAELLPGREARLASAVLLGVRDVETRHLSEPFAALGLAHLFAVSGLHVGILLGLVMLPGKMGRWSPRLSLVPLWIFVPMYVVLTGAPGSVVRAGGMGLLAAHAQPSGRKTDPLRLLGLLYWSGIMWQPAQGYDCGLQLSYLAAGGILLVSRQTNGLRFSSRRCRQAIAAGVVVSLAAQWFTLPVAAASFGRLNVWSPVANLLVVPLFGLAVWILVLALVVGLVCLPLARDIGALAWLVLRGLSGGVSWLSGLSTGSVVGLPVPGLYQCGVWFVMTGLLLAGLRWRRQRKRTRLLDLALSVVLPGLLVLIFGPWARTLPQPETVVIWQFDVGQGDCGLVVFPDGWTALIDTGGRYGRRAGPRQGPFARRVDPFLRRQGIDRIDAVLLTHGHRDHVGGAAAVADAFDVGTWRISGGAGHSVMGLVDSLSVVRAAGGEVLHTWREWSLRLWYPAQGQTSADSENNWSLVASLRRGDRTLMVWSGDLETAGEAALLASAPELHTTEVWKAGHHGSNTSGSPAMLARLQPQLVLVSCGLGNGYGHPSHGPYVVSRDAVPDTCTVLRTDLTGSIRLSWDRQGCLLAATGPGDW